MDTDTGLKSTVFENIYIQGARAMLRRLLEDGLINPKKGFKGGDVYVNATVKMITESVENTRLYVLGERYWFRNHERDKKGKLIKCEAYFIK